MTHYLTYKNNTFLFENVDGLLLVSMERTICQYNEYEILDQKIDLIVLDEEEKIDFENNKALLLEALLRFKKMQILL